MKNVFFPALIMIFIANVSCIFPGHHIKTNHEWPRMAQYPNKRFKTHVFAEKIMPLGQDSFWEIRLTVQNIKNSDIKDIQIVDETMDLTIAEEFGSTFITWHVHNERWSDKTPFRISIATEQNALKTLFIVTHSAKDQRVQWEILG